MSAKLLSTMTIKIFDNRSIEVTVDGIDGVNAKMVETAERLLQRKLHEERAKARQRASSANFSKPPVNSPKDQPLTPEAAAARKHALDEAAKRQGTKK